MMFVLFSKLIIILFFFFGKIMISKFKVIEMKQLINRLTNRQDFHMALSQPYTKNKLKIMHYEGQKPTSLCVVAMMINHWATTDLIYSKYKLIWVDKM